MRTLALLALALPLAACAPMSYSQGSYATTGGYAEPTPAPEPQVDNRNAGQVVVDIMAAAGYTCTALDTNWECLAPNSNWQLYVSYVPADDGSITIWFDSWLERAFAKPCTEFSFAMQDLADTSGAFQASCDDNDKKFRLNTAVAYGSELDVTAWVHDHEARRVKAGQNLRSIRALSRDSARIVASN